MTLSSLNYTKAISYVALFYAFSVPLSRAGIGISTALLIILWILEGNFTKKKALYKNSNVIISIGLFLSFLVFSLIWTDEIINAIMTIRRYWYLFPLIIFMTSLQKEFIPKVLSAFIMGMFVSEVIAYGVFFELWEFKDAIPSDPSPFMNHIKYSIFLALTSLILLARIFTDIKLRDKILYFCFFITVTGNLFLIGGRTGQLAFIISLCVLFFLSIKHKLKALVLGLILNIIILTFALSFSKTFKMRIHQAEESIYKVIKDKNYCTSIGNRVASFIVSKDIILADPLLGVGQEDNMKRFHEIIKEKYPEMSCMYNHFVHTHNQYLQILTASGIIGLIIFMSIFYNILKVQVRDKYWIKIKYVYVTILVISFFPDVILDREFHLALFALIIGLLLAQERVEREEKMTKKDFSDEN